MQLIDQEECSVDVPGYGRKKGKFNKYSTADPKAPSWVCVEIDGVTADMLFAKARKEGRPMAVTGTSSKEESAKNLLDLYGAPKP